MEREPSSQKLSKEVFKQEMIETLRHLKNDYKSEIPNEIKNSISPDQKWKVRKAWFATIKTALYRIRGKITLPKELFDETINFEKRHIGDEKGLTTQEDIDAADEIIDKVLAELEK